MPTSSQGPSPCHSVTVFTATQIASPLGVLLPGNGLGSTHPPFPRSLKCCSFHKLQRLNNTQVPGCSALLNSNIPFYFPLPFSLSKDLVVPRSQSKPRPSKELVFLYSGLVHGIKIQWSVVGVGWASLLLSRLSFPKDG